MNTGVSTVNVAGTGVRVTVTHEPSVIAYELHVLKSSVVHPAKLVVGIGVACNSVDSNAKPSLLQLCIRTRCLVVQLQRMPLIPQDLIEFLVDSKITFVVLDGQSAVAKLKEGHGLVIGKFVDPFTLESMVPKDLESLGSKVCGVYFRKAPTLPCFYSHSSVLTTDELRNAVVDAYAAYIIGAKQLQACECSLPKVNK